MVEYKDNSIIAQMGKPDMRIPIQYAITYPNKIKYNLDSGLSFKDLNSLTFKEMDFNRFPMLALAYKVGKMGGIMPAVFNASNEEAVKLFCENKIKFLETPGASFQDTSFCFKTLSLAQRIILTNKAYLYYRQDNTGSSVHQKDKVFLICKEYDEITDFLDKNPEVKKYANTQKLIKQYSAYIWNLKRISEEILYFDALKIKIKGTVNISEDKTICNTCKNAESVSNWVPALPNIPSSMPKKPPITPDTPNIISNAPPIILATLLTCFFSSKVSGENP